MNTFLSRLSVRNRIWMLVVLLIGSIVVGGLVDILTLREEMWREKEQKTRQLVEVGYSVLVHYHDMQARGALSEAQAQQAAKDAIRAMRYGEAEYFWLTDLNLPLPRMVMHPIMPELDGKILDVNTFNVASETRIEEEGAFSAVSGRKNLFAALVEVVNRNGKGYVLYDWPKPQADSTSSAQRYPKLSYVQKFEPWGWVIGSGVYVDEVDAVVRAQGLRTLLFLAGSGAVLLMLASLIAGSISRPLHRTVMAMRRIGVGGNAPTQYLPTDGDGEIAELAEGFNDMVGQLQERDAVLARHRESLEAEVARRTLELQESSIRMRALIDAANESILLLDAKGEILAINAFGANRFGKTAQDITGKNFFELLPGSLADKRRELVHSVFTTQQPQQAQDSRGAVFFSNSLYPVKNAAGMVESVAVFAKDVTEQHQTKEVDALFSKLDAALLKQRMNLESIAQRVCEEILPLFDLAGAWVGRTGPDGQLVPVASADGNHTGLAPDQVASTITLPLSLRGSPWGVLTLYGREVRQFDSERLSERMTAIANRLGNALESAIQQEWLTLLETALAGVGNSVLITDAKANIVWVNHAFTVLSGLSSEEVLGKNPRILSAGVQDADFYRRFWQSIQTGRTWHGDMKNIRPDGTRYTVSQMVTPLLNAEGQVSHYVAILEDITRRRHEEERIKHSANYDLLTDLPNRSLFFDRLGQALALGRRDGTCGALMFLDLDHFKEVNDQLGHAAGDSLLVAVARRLRDQVRESDTVARLGGDEFTVTLPNVTDSDDVARVADSIIAALGKPFDIAGTQAHIGVSIGIALFPRDGHTVERILSAADHAMYLSKANGRNCYHFASTDDAPTSPD